MKALLQRVSRAQVNVDNGAIASISAGLLVFVGIESDDRSGDVARLAERIAGYRIFSDPDDRMNLSIADIGGELLLVSQFTLAADTRKGMRPGFGHAAPPETARVLFEELVSDLERRVSVVRTGRFGANMQVELVNEGPVTFLLDTRRD